MRTCISFVYIYFYLHVLIFASDVHMYICMYVYNRLRWRAQRLLASYQDGSTRKNRNHGSAQRVD